MRRIFLALYPPLAVQEDLASVREQMEDLPARWTDPEQIHVTLAFLGNRGDREVEEIGRIAESCALASESFELGVLDITWGPDAGRPRMVWARLEENPRLDNLHAILQKGLGLSRSLSYKPESGKFAPHLTLARLREGEFRKMNPDERPALPECSPCAFVPERLSVMESVLAPAGAKHKLVESFPFLKRKIHTA